MSNQISILRCILLIGILRCVHGGAPKPFESKYGERFMGRKIVEAPGNITRSTFPVENDESNGEKIVQQSIINNSTRGGEELSVLSCTTGNPIDDCWRCDPNWERNRKRLADCGIGFGKHAIGGKNGKLYVVTDPSDDAANPSNGTLRHAVIQTEPLWIIFHNDMFIQLKEELVLDSFKTIDGRGAKVHIGKGPCITIKDATNIIIHGIHIHDCTSLRKAEINMYPLKSGPRKINHGDGISISTARHIWVDHCSMSNCEDGLIDAVKASTYITISNNYFTHHNKVMLLGHSDDHHHDKVMQATVALNHFREGLVQRMPRCRFGYFHVFNNDYTEWGMYAIGGSSNPTILSQGNRFMASGNPLAKEVTKRQNSTESEWNKWNWISEDDALLNGAYFTPSGSQVLSTYTTAYSGRPKSSAIVEEITRNAGVLSCKKGTRC
eukprot:PITA_13739